MIARLALVLPVYLAIYSACFLLAYLLRFDLALPRGEVRDLVLALPWILGVKAGWVLITREWRRRHRYTTVGDAKSLIVLAAAGAATLLAINTLLRLGVPRSVILIDAFLNIVAIGSLRAALRIWNDLALPSGAAKQRTLIYGCDPQAVSLLRALDGSGSEHLVVGMVDPRPGAPSSVIGGKPVFGADRVLHEARRLNARHMLIPANVHGQQVRTLVHTLHEAGIKAHVIPGVNELVEGRYKLAIRDVTIEDLLRRPPARLDQERIRSYIEGKRVMVTGGAGSIGSELCRQVLALRPHSLVLLDQSEYGVFAMEQEFSTLPAAEGIVHYIVGDILNREMLESIVAEHRPQLIFHAAAYKHVPLMESNPREAIRNNVFGTQNVVDAADHCGAEALVLISTDKAVRPTSVMGSTKLVAEKYLQAVAADSSVRLVTVRFGNVLNSMGSVVPTFRRQIAAGGPLTVTHPDMVRYFMTIPEAVQLVLQAGAIGGSGDLLILDMGEPVKILDLAKDMIELSGLRYPEDIDIVITGMRPGEKLYEELFYESEMGFRKVHEKIFLAPRSSLGIFQARLDLQELEAVLMESPQRAAQMLARIVADYVARDGAVERAAKAA
jgi:FlaA1/EpsC-like NDP-sugar epimerase